MCQGMNFTYLDCIHPICVPCFKDYAHKEFPNMKCLKCKEPISEFQKRAILGKEEFSEIEQNFLMGVIGTTVTCVNNQCREQIVFEKGNVDYNTKDEKGSKLSKQSAESYANNRCRCASCKIDFCVSCKTSPYHIGKTCEEHITYVTAKRCRYDNIVITNSNRGPAGDVCNNPECILQYDISCPKKLKCGHHCFGVKGESKCPPCLYKDCPEYVNIFDQEADSYCNICYTEGFVNSPIVRLGCNHIFHYKCIEAKLKKKWVGPKITFNHGLCPQCNAWMEFPYNPDLQEAIKETRALYDTIAKMAIERLKFEGLEKDERLKDPNSSWYKKDLEFALHKISYYMCYVCSKPYFAGMRECRGGPGDNNNPNREYDPKDLICGAHANIAGVAGTSDCKTHGKDFIEYKCKFCCNISSWFCWGTTHFCEDCHARQCKGDYVSKYERSKLPKCPGINKCPLKIKHSENGEEFALGCSVCRNHSENVKNF